MSCVSWFNVNEIAGPVCDVEFCPSTTKSCTGECIQIYSGNRTGTFTIGDKVYTKEGDIYVLLPPGRYVVSTLGVHILIGGSNEFLGFQACSTGTSVDVDGNIYSTVVIGGKTWFKENLRTTRYNDGSEIFQLPLGAWINDRNGSYATSDETCFGFYYNWFAVDNERGLCPTGWHVPTLNDWDDLREAAGKKFDAGINLKVPGSVWWENPTIEEPNNRANSTGFNAFPTGKRHCDGEFELFSEKAIYWSSSVSICSLAWCAGQLRGTAKAVHLHSNKLQNKLVDFQCDSKNNGYSVRCIKD
jgi:uncharacterized protein (TIGR02145 family)